MTDRITVSRYYDERAAQEYCRLDQSPLHQAEWLLTLDLINEYIATGATVLDIGAGPGRYTEYLLRERGCRVGLVDISPACVQAFQERIGPNENVFLARASCATDLSFIPDATADALLLMGPLYHLTNPAERQTALAECRRTLKPGGYLFAAFVSPYPLFPRILERDPSVLDDPEFVRLLTEEGRVTTKSISNFVEQYRCWPNQAQNFLTEAGFTVTRTRNLEGVGALQGAIQATALAEPARRQAWFDLLRRTCEIPDLLGATIHFVCVARKPM